ncbi:MAG: DNA repair protein RecO [Clostridia bacterium]|nr:DNA repair protein RecO [Clostridia bacterium]
MASLTTPALVLRRSDYGDYDRMVTLFSPDMGRVDAIARGCRRPKSPLVNAVEPFTSGEYQLYAHKDRFSIEHCQISDSYYELRADYDRLCHGVYWLRLLDTSILPDSPAPELFIVTLRALAHLNYGELMPELVTFAFEMHFMRLNGLSPRMDACVRCGRPIDGDARFDPELGGAVCMNCPCDGPVMSNGARRILMKLPRTPFDKFQLLADRPQWPEAARLCRSYVNMRMYMDKYAPALYSPDPDANAQN